MVLKNSQPFREEEFAETHVKKKLVFSAERRTTWRQKRTAKTRDINLKNGKKTPFREVRIEAKTVTALQKIAVSGVIKKQKAPQWGIFQTYRANNFQTLL